MVFSTQRIWPEITIAVFAVLVLALPPQVHDLYRALALTEGGVGFASTGWNEIADIDSVTRESEVLIVALATLALFLGFSSAAALSEPAHRFFSSPPSWIAALAIGALPAVGAVFGLTQSLIPEDLIATLRPIVSEHSYAAGVEALLRYGLELPDAQERAKQAAAQDIAYLENYAGNVLSIQLSLLMAAIPSAALGAMIGVGAVRQFAGRRSHRLLWAVLGVLAIAAMPTILYLDPVETPTLLTPFGVLVLFLIAMLTVIRSFLGLLKSWAMLAAFALAAMAAVFSYYDLNDNHTIRTARPEQDYLNAPGFAKDARENDRALPKAHQEFIAWLAERGAMRSEPDAPFPVFIVAAEGGGIYAAFHTAVFLSRLTDRCPKFSRHLFAASGVSGGSVGASVYARDLLERSRSGAIDVDRCEIEDTVLERKFSLATEVLSEDHLSPLIAAAMFNDTAQFFIPLRVESFDRAKQQEKALEFWIARKTRGDGSPASYLESWRPSQNDQRGLALLLNATEVGSGHRRVFSPFQFEGIGLDFFPSRFVYPSARAQRITPLSTAAHISARFPWISPAAWFTDEDGRKRRVVDGGYFENSGVATALDLVTDLDRGLQRRADALSEPLPNLEFHILVLNSDGFDTSRMFGLPEVFEPVRAMLSTRSARSDLEIKRLKAFQQAGNLKTGPIFVHEHLLDAKKHPLPLGWKLSALIRQLISAQIGLPQSCRKDERLSGACVQRDIIKRLKD